jgi:site-specific DNA-adenine methylase
MPQHKLYDRPADRVRAFRQRQKLQRLAPLTSLFPYYGGKAQVAPILWQSLGEVRHYLEPFAGSLAVLLARPHRPRVETVNDRDGHLVNLWRALAADPGAVAQHARWPVSSIDLWARHDYLYRQQASLTAHLVADHRYYDPELAGLWLYCRSTWAGSGMGLKAGRRPQPHVSHTGSGIHAMHRRGQLPRLCTALQVRLKTVRVLCGDWQDCLSERLLHGSGSPVGILLDPPYSLERREQALYATQDACAPAVRDWAVAHGGDARLRIALCGLEGEHQMPASWTAYHWQARGGLANTKHHGRGSGETRQEVVWFSPGCLQPAHQLDLHV